MTVDFLIEYEALVYNLPIIKNFSFLNHMFTINNVDNDTIGRVGVDKDFVDFNYNFIRCCYSKNDEELVYVTLKPIEPVRIVINNVAKNNIYDEVIKVVDKNINSIEEHLILITNLHIFFTAIRIKATSMDGIYKKIIWIIRNKPLSNEQWKYDVEGINLYRRINLKIDKTNFDNFRFGGSHFRYKKAFDYYIQSFNELNHSVAFLLLCSSIDAMTGQGREVKKRLAKYSSVLFCEPLKTDCLENEMKYYYKLRSEYIHGKGSKISIQDEINLREYVRRFLIAYYIFYNEMNVNTEREMLEKLDQIYDDHSLYLKYAPGAYSFIALMVEHERKSEGIFNNSFSEKKKLVDKKLIEAAISSEKLEKK